MSQMVFKGFLPYKGMAVIWVMGHVTQIGGNKVLFPLSIEDPYEIWFLLAKWILERRHLKSFPYICKTNDPWGGAIFWPQGYNSNK